jgi:hypothetical protein
MSDLIEEADDTTDNVGEFRGVIPAKACTVLELDMPSKMSVTWSSTVGQSAILWRRLVKRSSLIACSL